ncbi:TraR/DksA C4-type zinc finger protein [Caulobacter henricii]|uniref:Zinc finger DksA/TraR C4-type domain-containing protein n=1 Tax=Caulobacter henricii TaxID=69395 RepID=A0A0P0P189_9CAUL|nr:TraR/DksA C4-type zinc finger protein [Caulobacter henricii]ALL14276.1 hypothetical protein AQ619_13500 [Caulobacter henricii]
MSDIVDRAQEIEGFARERAIERVRGQAHARGPEDLVACVECGDPIGLERREVRPGALRCVECEEARERVQRLFSRG